MVVVPVVGAVFPYVVPVVVVPIVPIVPIVVIPIARIAGGSSGLVVLDVMIVVPIIVINVVAPVIVGVMPFPVHFQHFAGGGVDFVFVLHSIQHKFNFVGAVVDVVVFFHKLQIVPLQLGRQNAFGSLGVDITLISILVVVVILIYREGLGGYLPGF